MAKSELRCYFPLRLARAEQKGLKPKDAICIFAWACAALGNCMELVHLPPTTMKQLGEEREERFYHRLEETIQLRGIDINPTPSTQV